MSELKPCPCGGSAKLLTTDGISESYSVFNDVMYKKVICTDCSFSADDADDWNNRSPQSEWVSVDDKLPESIDGKWSKPVIAMCDKGLIYRLSYFKGDEGSCWQRTSAFASNDSSHVMYWMEIPEIID